MTTLPQNLIVQWIHFSETLYCYAISKKLAQLKQKYIIRRELYIRRERKNAIFGFVWIA